MTILNKDWPVEFPFPTVIRTVVCSDLDETYIPSDSDKKNLVGSFSWNPILHPMPKKRGFSLAGSQEQIWIQPGENPGDIYREALTLYVAVSAPNFTG